MGVLTEANPVVAGRRRVLVVEDTADIRELLAEILGAEGYDVVAAANGAEALEALHHGDFHLILLDLMMPIMNGFELLMRLSQSAQGHPPVVAMSAFERFRGEARDLGAESFLSKPVDVDRLLQEVDRVIALSIDREKTASSEEDIERISRRLESWLDVERVSFRPFSAFRSNAHLSILLLGDASTEENVPGGLYARLPVRHHGQNVGVLELADSEIRDLSGEELAVAQFVADCIGARDDPALALERVALGDDRWGMRFAERLAAAVLERCRREHMESVVAVAKVKPESHALDRIRAEVGEFAHTGWLNPDEILIIARTSDGAPSAVLAWADHLSALGKHDALGPFTLGLSLGETGNVPLASEVLRAVKTAAETLPSGESGPVRHVRVPGYPSPWTQPAPDVKH